MRHLSLLFAFALSLVSGASPAVEALPLGLTHAPREPIATSVSSNWSGYADETNFASPANNAVSDVKASWRVPAVTCGGGNTYSSVWVGIDGYSSNTVEQTGTEQDCVSGRARYYAWYEMYPSPSVNVGSVAPGDLISAEVSYIGAGQFLLSLTRNGAPFYSTIQTNSSALRQSAEWIVEAPAFGRNILPLANFGNVTLSGGQATMIDPVTNIPATRNIAGFPYDDITMAARNGTVKARPSALTNGGDTFTVTWAHK